MLCSLRQRAWRSAKSDSKNCTAVVTITAASQFSIASRSLSRASGSGCGAAALATLLNYQHGDPISEREIAKGLIQREEYI
jgi:predicted double-glycine peptidase